MPTTPVHHVRDLRAYVQRLRELGEIQEITTPASLDEEVGAVIRRSYELRAPAPWFRNIEGTDNRFSLLGAPAGVSAQPGRAFARIAVSLGLPPSSDGRTIIEQLAAARDRAPIPHAR